LLYDDQITITPAVGDVTTSQAHVEPNTDLVRDAQGTQEVPDLFIVLPPSQVDITIRDIITWNSADYVVVKASPLRFGGTCHHVEIYAKTAGDTRTVGGF